MRKLLHKSAEYLLRALLFVFAILPLKVHYFNAVWLAFLVRRVFRYRVDVVRSNLQSSFPELDAAALGRIEAGFYRHFTEIFTEAIWFGGCFSDRRLRRSRIVEISNPEVLSEAYDNASSIVVLYSHTGNWELLGGIASYNFTGKPSPVTEQNYCIVYRRLSSEIWDNIMRTNRFAPLKDRKDFEGYLESRSIIRYVLRHSKEKKIYNFNTDQRPYFSAPSFIRVNFMNRGCDTMSSAADLAVKMGMPVLYQSMRRKEDSHGYVLSYTPICRDASHTTSEEIMKQYYKLLEADIREQPENYLWTHNRWWHQ